MPLIWQISIFPFEIRYISIKVFRQELRDAIDEITGNCREFIIGFCLKILPCEITVFRFRKIRRKCITQDIGIAFARKIFLIISQENSPIIRLGKFLSFEIQEFICGYILRKYHVAFGHQKHRENQRMKDDIIFTQKGDIISIFTFWR